MAGATVGAAKTPPEGTFLGAVYQGGQHVNSIGATDVNGHPLTEESHSALVTYDVGDLRYWWHWFR